MVIKINTQWGHSKEMLTAADMRAFCREQGNLDQLIFYGRMEQLRLGMQGLRLKYLRKMLRHKFPPDYDETAYGRQTIRNQCWYMAMRLKKNQDPEDRAFLEAMVALLKKLPHLRKLLLLPKRIQPLALTSKLYEVNLLSKIMTKRLKSRLAGNATERRLQLVKKDRLDVLLALRCNCVGRKIPVTNPQFLSIQEDHRIDERNVAHQKLHLRAKLEAFRLRLDDYTKGREPEYEKVAVPK